MNLGTSTAAAPIVPGGPHRGSRITVVLIVLAVLAVAAAVVYLTRDSGAVSTRTSAEPTPGATSAPTRAPDPQAGTKAAVIEAYKKDYAGFVAVGREASPNLDDPRLTQHSTGAALEAKRRALADHKAKGQVYVGDFESHPTVIDLSSTTATVVDCTVDRTALVHARSGSTIVGAGDGKGIAGTAKMVVEGGRWKVSDFKDEKRSCVPPAA